MNPQPLPQTFSASLIEHRRELDSIDAQLVSLLAARFAITRRIGALKAAHGVAAADPAREQAQLERLLVLSAAEELPTEVTRTVFETLFRFVRANHLAQANSTNERGVDG
ncbi:MAG: chorismate mutase [Polyangiaceae bacterium]